MAGDRQVSNTSRMDSYEISALDPHPRKHVAVLDSEMSYVDTGEGTPIVFLHGNPTSSYLWRNVIPYLMTLGRCLAPDLIGMGNSGKSSTGTYRFVDHFRYLEGWFKVMALKQDVVLVLHDWGSALGFHWASQHPEAIRGIVYMEAIVQPRLWSDFPAGRDELFRNLRSEMGERMVMDDNFFIEVVLPHSVLRTLSEEEMNAYRDPFRSPSDRWPTLVWPRELPIGGEPRDVVTIVETYGRWLAESRIPKLFINADPGAIIGSRARQFCRSWPNQREVTVKGIHFVQEDSPREIGVALQEFVRDLNELVEH